MPEPIKNKILSFIDAGNPTGGGIVGGGGPSSWNE